MTELKARNHYKAMGYDYDEHERLVNVLLKAWTELDASELLNNIHPDFQYDSQWVFASMNAEEYKKYIVGKFETIKKTDAAPIVELASDTGVADTLGGSMVHLNQNGNHAFLRVKCRDNKIIKMDMCMF